MTKEQAVTKLMREYHAGEKWRDFFERTVESLVGPGDFVTNEIFENIKTYLNNYT